MAPQAFSLVFGGTHKREESINSMINIVGNATGSDCFRAGLDFQQLIYFGEEGQIIVTKHCNCPGVTTGDYIIVSDNIKVSQMVFNSVFQFLTWASSNPGQIGTVINLLQGNDSYGPMSSLFKYAKIKSSFIPEESYGLGSSLWSGFALDSIIQQYDDSNYSVALPRTLSLPKYSTVTMPVIDYIVYHLKDPDTPNEAVPIVVYPAIKNLAESVKIDIYTDGILCKEELSNVANKIINKAGGACVRRWIEGDVVTVFSLCGLGPEASRVFRPIACYGEPVKQNTEIATVLNEASKSIASLVGCVGLVSSTYVVSGSNIYIIDVDVSPSLAADSMAYDCLCSALSSKEQDGLSPIIAYLSSVVNLA